MIDALCEYTRLELNRRFGCEARTLLELRSSHGSQISRLLVEDAGKVEKVYLLLLERPGVIRLTGEELTREKVKRLPFTKPAGSQSGAVGPVLKRTVKPSDHPPYGPSVKILDTTLEGFRNHAKSAQAWSPYFQDVVSLLEGCETLLFNGEALRIGAGEKDKHALAAAVRVIPEKKNTAFLAVVDSHGRWPGDVPEFNAYLAHALADVKYTTRTAPSKEAGRCPMCGASPVRLYPNAMKGGGLNIANVDREGAFPDQDVENAWKAYALCVDCADALYIFKNHLMQSLLGPVAGERALLIPDLYGGTEGDKLAFLETFQTYVKRREESGSGELELDLMEFFTSGDDAQLLLHVLWASFGSLIEEVRGLLTEILPSRLKTLHQACYAVNAWSHPASPRVRLPELELTLSLSCLGPLFKRAGGKKASSANESPRLFEVRRLIASSLYHGTPLKEAEAGFHTEWWTTARYYVDEALASGDAWGLINEGRKDARRWLTPAGWIRHLARFMVFLKQSGVMPMDDSTFVFSCSHPRLKEVAATGSGIDSPEKAFAFVLGILFGKLLQVQSARGVNVGANALTWLKRLQLSGRDLPELYTKIREKLLSYESEGNPDIRQVVLEASKLGAALGDRIELSTTPTCYFLLLGQALSVEVLPSSTHHSEDKA